MRLLLPLALVLAAGFPALAAPQGLTVGPAQVLPGDLAVGPAGGVQRFPAVAAGGGVHLAAWEDHRSGFEGLLTGVGGRDVYARLLGPDGAPLSPLPLRVAGGLGRKEDVRVAWNGQHFLVTWRSELPTTFYKAAALLGARVDSAGNVLDEPPLVIRSFSSSSTFAYGLGSDGQDWAVVVQGSQAGEAAVEGWRVRADGVVQQLSASVFPIAYLVLDFQLAWDGAQYLLTFSDSGTRGYRTTSALATLGSKLTISSAGTGEASPTSAGGGFLVSFTVEFSAGSDIAYRAVGPTGTLGPITTVTSTFESDVHSSLAWNGAGYTLVWWRAGLGTNELRHARLDAAGALLDPGGLPFGQGVQPAFPAVSSLTDGNAQVVWVDFATTPAHVGDVFGTRLTGTSVAPEVAVAASASRQGFPDLAADASGYAAVFASERAGAISIVAQRMDAGGAALDLEPIELGAKASYGAPQVAWNGQHYLVVWHDLQDASAVTDDVVLARRLAADGTPIDPAPFLVLQGADPSVAAVGSTFLVAARFAFTTQNFLIQGARVNGAGQVLDASPLAIGGNFARWPQVASFGDRWLVAWQRNPTHDHPSANAMARVVLADGTMAAAQSLGGGTRPDAAASPSTGLVAWGGGDVLLQRLAADGSLLGATFVGSAAPETQAEVAAGWNGAEFVVAWEDRREAEAFYDDRHDIYAARVSESGVVLDPAGVAVATSPDEEQMPAVAGRDGTALVAWAGQVVGAPHATVRTTVARLSPGACSATSYCVGAPNSAGPGAALSHTGSTSVAADDLVLHCDGAVPGAVGLFYYGTAAAQVPFGNGFRCIGGQTFRLAGQVVGAGGTAARAVDLANPPHAAGQITPGSTWHFQFWFRDTPAGGAGFNLSDGLSLDFCD